MKLAILFWFYKDLEVCQNRLELLRKINPNTPIYGLYGGEEAAKNSFENNLKLDDFFSSTVFQDSYWKWRNGDLLLVDWYNSRGKNLDWDSLAIVQWDTLFFAPVKEIFNDISTDQIFLSGVRPLSSWYEKRWVWTKGQEYFEEKDKNFYQYISHSVSESEVKQWLESNQKEYLRFKELIRTNYNYLEQLLQSIFLLQVLSRAFFEAYGRLPNLETGFLEYKLPTYAKVLSFSFFDKDIGTWYQDDRDNKALMPSARGEISRDYIESQLQDPNGWRIFHPFFQRWEAREE